MPQRKKAVTKTKETVTPKSLMAAVNKRWPGAMRMASDPDLVITRIESGILSVDVLLGGGFPRGRHTEIYGPFSVGKTYITLRLIAQAQADGFTCAYIDCEGAFDPEFAELCGVDLDTLTIHRQTNGHRVFDFMETLIVSELYDLIVLDSIASLLPKSEAEGQIEAATMGTAQARLMSLGLRKVTTALTHSNVALVYINQIREAIGVMFGDRTVTSGGKAMGHYSGVRLEISRSENIKRKARVVSPTSGSAEAKDVIKAHRALMRVKKDKTGGAAQHKTSTFVFDYELKGIDHLEDLIYLGREYGLVHKSGSRWWLEDCEDEAQASRARFKSWLRKNAAVAEELEQLIKECASAEGQEVEDEDDEATEEDEGEEV